RQNAFGYFRDLGFVCPPRRDVADFLLDQQQYQVANAWSQPHPQRRASLLTCLLDRLSSLPCWRTCTVHTIRCCWQTRSCTCRAYLSSGSRSWS
ncbi:TPA: hypothetical protein N0F65_009955, partial [Lagenidium giganteum]